MGNQIIIINYWIIVLIYLSKHIQINREGNVNL